MDTGVVVNDPPNRRFTLDEAGQTAELLYRRNGSRFIVVHTEVPESLGGRGIGGRLVGAAVEFAASEGLTLVPWCPYARKWLTDHPEQAAAVPIDWARPTG